MFDELIETRVRTLAEAFVRTGFERVRVADGEVEIELRRAWRPAAAAETSPPEAAAEPDAASYDVVTADLVGRVRFLRPAVGVGMLLEADREIASIEALGIRNPIRSQGPGRVAVVFVEEGQAVDYGAPLFAIDRTPAR